MFEKSDLEKIAKHIESLDFVTEVDMNEVEIYEDENDSSKLEQVDINITVDDRISIMDDKKQKRLKNLLKKDDTLPDLIVKFERIDAYPSGYAAYTVTLYWEQDIDW